MKNFVFLFLLLAFSQISYAQEPADTIIVEDIEDIDLDDIEDDEIAEASSFPWERFAVGGQIGNLQFGDVTAIGIAPEVTYKLNDVVTAGIGGLFDFTSYNRIWNGFQFVDADYSATNIAGRAFSRITPIESLPVFVQLEYERISQETPYNVLQDSNTGEIFYPNVDQNLNNYVVGLGFNNGPGYIALLYNITNVSNRDDFAELAREDSIEKGYPTPNNLNNIYPYNALSFRAGLLIPLGSNKNRRRQ